jgi:hypothetical protein
MTRRKPLLIGRVIVRDDNNLIVYLPLDHELPDDIEHELRTANIPDNATEYRGYRIQWPRDIA